MVSATRNCAAPDSAAYLGVFPSSAEGWGLGVSECLSFGLPVIHSDLPALSEAAQGLMPSFAAGDGEALHAALFDLLSAPEKVEALRAVARTRYRAGPESGFAEKVYSRLRAESISAMRDGPAMLNRAAE